MPSGQIPSGGVAINQPSPAGSGVGSFFSKAFSKLIPSKLQKKLFNFRTNRVAPDQTAKSLRYRSNARSSVLKTRSAVTQVPGLSISSSAAKSYQSTNGSRLDHLYQNKSELETSLGQVGHIESTTNQDLSSVKEELSLAWSRTSSLIERYENLATLEHQVINLPDKIDTNGPAGYKEAYVAMSTFTKLNDELSHMYSIAAAGEDIATAEELSQFEAQVTHLKRQIINKLSRNFKERVFTEPSRTSVDTEKKVEVSSDEHKLARKVVSFDENPKIHEFEDANARFIKKASGISPHKVNKKGAKFGQNVPEAPTAKDMSSSSKALRQRIPNVQLYLSEIKDIPGIKT